MRGDFLSCLNMIYGKPASVTVIKGDWKTGKTNFGLYLAQVLKKCNLVQQMGGNIECFKDLKTRERDPKFEFIDNFLRLEMWGYTPFRKVYIFDEAIKNAPSRNAMTKLNKKWLEIIPELSKMRCHLIGITQEDEYIESIFKNKRFLHAEWNKLNYSKSHPFYRKVVTLKSSKYFHGIKKFKPIPKTSLLYDPYQTAIMTLEPKSNTIDGLPMEIKIAFDYGDGLSMQDIKEKYKLPTRKQSTREVRKGICKVKYLCLVSNHLRRVIESRPVTQSDQS